MVYRCNINIDVDYLFDIGDRVVFMTYLFCIFNFLNITDLDYCSGLMPVIIILRSVVSVIQFGIPILLIVFGMLDLGKAVIAGKEEEMKKYQGMLIKRFVYAVCVFFVVTIVIYVMDVVDDSGAIDEVNSSWYDCWMGSNNVFR